MTAIIMLIVGLIIFCFAMYPAIKEMKSAKMDELDMNKFAELINGLSEKAFDDKAKRLYYEGIRLASVPTAWQDILDIPEDEYFVFAAAGLVRELIKSGEFKDGEIKLFRDYALLFINILRRMGYDKDVIVHFDGGDITVKINKEEFEKLKKLVR